MVEIIQRLCYLCYQEGNKNVAVAKYRAEEDWYDVCRKHMNEVAELEMTVIEIEGEATNE